jgi:hypothetical protein
MLTELIAGIIFAGNMGTTLMLPMIAWQHATLSPWYLPARSEPLDKTDEQWAIQRHEARRAFASGRSRGFRASRRASRGRNARSLARVAPPMRSTRAKTAG